MNKTAIFSDGTKCFRDPAEPKPKGSVRIRLRADAEDTLVVYLSTTDKKIPMQRTQERNNFCLYEAEVILGTCEYRYWFEIKDKNETCYYNRMGIFDRVIPEYDFRIFPGFSTPDWAKGAIMYQIMVDRFANGDTQNDVSNSEYEYIGKGVHKIEDWNKPPESFDVANFYGGDLEGVRSKFNYLKSLGVEVIFFNPIFVSPSNHKYDTQDYDYIDPHIGKIIEDNDCEGKEKYIRRVTSKKNLEASNKYFADFIKEAHDKGIRVILDGVFNHCGSFHKWMDREGIYKDQKDFEKGAFWSGESPYVSYFNFLDDDWPKNDSYEGWWQHGTLPKLNYDNSEKLQEEILRIAKKWVSPPYNADGWRLDVAADLGHSEEFNHKFWKKFREAVKEANPQAIILAEHYGDAYSWLRGDEWDTIMNYDAFMDPVSYFFTGMEKHSDAFDEERLGNGIYLKESLLANMLQAMMPTWLCSMNQLSNHDHSRFLTRTNHLVGRVGDLGSDAAWEGISCQTMKLATLFQMIWPGAPTLYYGDEAGQVGFTDPDSRRTYPWGNENKDMISYFRDVIFLHKKNEALKYGSLIFLENEKDYISIGRFTDERHVVAAFNIGDTIKECAIPVWRAGVSLTSEMKRVFITEESGHSIYPEAYTVENGYLHCTLEPNSGIVFFV